MKKEVSPPSVAAAAAAGQLVFYILKAHLIHPQHHLTSISIEKANAA